MTTAATVLDCAGERVRVSHPDKVLFPGEGITKADLARYYAGVAEVAFPLLRDRPVTQERFPDGIGSGGFYHKDIDHAVPGFVGTVELAKRGGTVRHVVVAHPAALVWLAQQNCVTPHIGLARTDRLRQPDRLIVDLDPPGDEVDDAVVDLVRHAARRTRAVFEEAGLTPFVMTTGSRGLHVVAPLRRGPDYEVVGAVASVLASHIAARDPQRLTTAFHKAKRGRRLYLDVGRNGYAQTAVAPYAVRARPGAPVATPLDWDELGRTHPAGHDLASIPRRLGQKACPWADIDAHAAALPGLEPSAAGE